MAEAALSLASVIGSKIGEPGVWHPDAAHSRAHLVHNLHSSTIAMPAKSSAYIPKHNTEQ